MGKASKKRKFEKPPKDLSFASDSSTFVSMEDDLRRKVDSLEATIKELKSTIDELSKRPAPACSSCQCQAASNPTSAPSPLPSSFLADRVKMAYSASLMPDKALYAVVERLMEPTDILLDKNSKQSSPSDMAFLNTVCNAANIACPIDCFRSPSKSLKRPRVLKVRFKSKDERDIFITKFRRSLPLPMVPLPSARRDLSPIELDLLYSLRRDVYRLNAEAGKNLHFVRDLRIAKTPAQFVRDFNVRELNNH